MDPTGYLTPRSCSTEAQAFSAFRDHRETDELTHRDAIGEVVHRLVDVVHRIVDVTSEAGARKTNQDSLCLVVTVGDDQGTQI